MRTQLSILALTLVASIASHAAIATRLPAAAPEEFGAMIQENKKSELALKKQLERDAGIHFNERPGMIAKSKMKSFTAEPVDQVALTTERHFKRTSKPTLRNRDADVKRLSQELRDSRY